MLCLKRVFLRNGKQSFLFAGLIKTKQEKESLEKASVLKAGQSRKNECKQRVSELAYG